MAIHEGIGCVAAHQVAIFRLLVTHQCWQALLHCVISDHAPSQVVTLSCRETMTQISRACLIWLLGSSQLACLHSSLKQAARTKRHARQTCMVHHSSWWMRDRQVAFAPVVAATAAVVTQIPSKVGQLCMMLLMVALFTTRARVGLCLNGSQNWPDSVLSCTTPNRTKWPLPLLQLPCKILPI